MQFIMKTNIFLASLVAATCMLVSCNKEIETPVSLGPDIPFVVYLQDNDLTKTVNDGYSTKWVEGDKLNVWHAVTGSTSYVMDNMFAVEDVNGRCTGTLQEELDPSSNYDWYACYPYEYNVSTPNHETGLFFVGGNYADPQSGNNSMSHLAGKAAFPLVGWASNVPAGEFPTLKMKNVASVMAFHITNNQDKDIIVNGIDVIAPDPVQGQVAVDFTTADVVSIISGGNKFTQMTVSDGTPIKTGEKGIFYMGVLPFTAETGTELVVYVNVTIDGKAVKQKFVKNMTENVSFNSGCIKAINVNYTEDENHAIEVTSDDFANFNLGYRVTTFKTDIEYSTFDGWILKNGALISEVNWDALSGIAPVINGKTSNVGVLTSPLISGGCGTLKFKYGVYNGTEQISFRLDVKNESGEIIYTENITHEGTAVKHEQHEYVKDINVSGNFQLEFTNLCPQQKTMNKDRVVIFDVTWTGYSE